MAKKLIETLPPIKPLPPMVVFGDCKKGETSAKTGCTPKGGGGGKVEKEEAPAGDGGGYENPFTEPQKKMENRYESLMGDRHRDPVLGEMALTGVNDRGVPYFSKVKNGKVQKKQYTTGKGKDWLDKQLSSSGGERIPKPSEGFILPNAARKLTEKKKAEIPKDLARIEKKERDYAAGEGSWTSLSPGEFKEQIEMDRDQVAVKERTIEMLKDVDSLPSSLDRHEPGSFEWVHALEMLAAESAPPDEKKRQDKLERKEQRSEAKYYRRQAREG